MKKLTIILIFFCFKLPVFAQTMKVNGNLKLTNGAQLIFNNTSLNNTNTITADTGSLIKFTGNQSASLAGSVAVNAGKVEIDNPAGLTLYNGLEVSNKLIFSSGIIYSSATNLVNFLNGSTAEVNSNLSFINGPIKRTGIEDFTFQAGNGTIARPIMVSDLSATETILTEYINDNPNGAGLVTTSKSGNFYDVSECEYWSISSVGNATGKISLSWSSFESCGISIIEDLRIAIWDGSKWLDGGSVNLDGDASSGSLQIDSAISFQAAPVFSLATTSAANPLPVELLSFEAEMIDGIVSQLVWETASELNSDYFIINRSNDGKVFEEIGRVKASGNSNNQNYYQIYDDEPKEVNYYTLNLVDQNGETNQLAAALLVSENWKNFTIKLNNTEIEIPLTTDNCTYVNFELYSVAGSIVYSKNYDNSDCKTTLHVFTPNNLNGIFIAKFTINNQLFTKQVFIAN